MDETQFDHLARIVAGLTTRRGTVAGLLGGVLGSLGLRQAEAKKGQQKDKQTHKNGDGAGRDRTPTRQDTADEAEADAVGAEAKSGNCNPVCNECSTCQTGKCKKKKGKKKCKKGTCLPRAAGTTCTVSAGITGACQSGACLPQCTKAANCPAPPVGQLCAVAACVDVQCQFVPKPPGTPCRAATGECDNAEVCDGISLDCPADTFKPAGTPCASDSDPCTQDICDGSSAACTHPTLPNNTACPAGICCSGSCISNATRSNCGVCGNVCPAETPCQAGRCCRPNGSPCDFSPGQCCSNQCSFARCA